MVSRNRWEVLPSSRGPDLSYTVRRYGAGMKGAILSLISPSPVRPASLVTEGM